MSNSSLVDVIVKSPNHSGQRVHSIDRITPHCVVGQLTAKSIGNCFPAGMSSCNYGIGSDAKVVLVVDECNRSWCSSSSQNDQRAVTIECASDSKEPYAFKESVYNKLVDLCTDICKRNGKTKLLWFNDKDKSLNYSPKSNEMVLTVHRWFANKSCPGDWLYSRMGNLAETVTNRLKGYTTPPQDSTTTPNKVTYRVRKTWDDIKSQIGAYTSLDNAKKCADSNSGYKVFDEKGSVVYSPVKSQNTDKPFQFKVIVPDLRIRKGAGTDYDYHKKGGKSVYTGKGTFTIVKTKAGKGASMWGLLKSYEKTGDGWISLDSPFGYRI